jgi:O-antigen/teichoic acid export membrane protein
MLRRLLSNATISLLGQIVTWSSTLALTLAYGRYLGDAQFGEFTFVTTLILLLGLPIGQNSGYNIQITRHLAQHPDEGSRILSNVVSIKAVGWALIYAVALACGWVFDFNAETRLLVAVIGATLLTSSISSALGALQYAHEHAAVPTIASVIEKVVSAVVGIVVLQLGGGVVGMSMVLLLGSALGFLWQALSFQRLVGISLAIDLTLVKELLRTNLPFLLYGVIGTLYYRVDVILLAAMTSDQVVGWYGASYRLFDTLGFVPALMFTLIYPIVSKMAVGSENGMKVAAEKLVNFTLFTGLPIATMLIVAAAPIMHFLYHRPEFDHGIASLQGLAPGLVFLYLNTALGMIFLNTKQDRKLPVQAAVALVFNVTANLVVIPHLLHVGAALVTSITEILLFGIVLNLVPRPLWPVGSLVVAGRALAASIVMAVVVWNLSAIGIWVVPVGGLVYLLMVVWMGVFERADLEALRNAVLAKGARAAASAIPAAAGGTGLGSVAAADGDGAINWEDAETIRLERALTVV